MKKQNDIDGVLAKIARVEIFFNVYLFQIQMAFSTPRRAR
jgi:hypothetical protein